MGFGSGWHWLIVLAVIVLLFGGKKLPELAKGLGKGIKTFKEEMAEDDTKKITKDETSSNSKTEIKKDEESKA